MGCGWGYFSVVSFNKIVYPDFFSENPDYSDERYKTKYGIYSENVDYKMLK